MFTSRTGTTREHSTETVQLMLFVMSFLITGKVICQDQQKMLKGAILYQMRQLGGATFSSQIFKTGIVSKQFLVAAVVPDAMLNDPAKLNLIEGCPILPNKVNEQKFSDTAMICATSAVVFNTVDAEIWEQSRWANNASYKNHSWHGEYMFLYGGILQQLQAQFLKTNPNQPCQIILYSHFIPCNYPSGKQPYRCTDLLLNYDNSKDKCKIKIIGYTSVFTATAKTDKNAEQEKTTDEKLRKRFEITKLVQNTKTDPSSVVFIDDVVKAVASSSTVTFQDEFVSCLLRSAPVMDCCVDANIIGNAESIARYFANLLVECFIRVKNKGNEAGSFSEQNTRRKQISEQFREFIESILGTNCIECQDVKRLQLYVGYCATKAFDMTDYFGSPDGQDLPLERYEDRWVNLFAKVPNEFWDTGRMRCLNNLSPSSLCTKKADVCTKEKSTDLWIPGRKRIKKKDDISVLQRKRQA